jgi:hypothetical protein
VYAGAVTSADEPLPSFAQSVDDRLHGLPPLLYERFPQRPPKTPANYIDQHRQVIEPFKAPYPR